MENIFKGNDAINQWHSRWRTGDFKRNANPNELSKTKGSIPARLLSVSVQIWLHIRSTVLTTADNEINLCMP